MIYFSIFKIRKKKLINISIPSINLSSIDLNKTNSI